MEKKENVKIRKVITNVRGKDILFDEYYLVNTITNEEIFDRQLEIENDIRLYDIYKEKTGLLTSNDIKRIRSKYRMNQKEYAFALGFGEITIHRFENGSIQTEAVDSIIRLSDNPDNMHDLLIKNKKNFSDDSYIIFMKRIEEIQRLKKHCIAKINLETFKNLHFEQADVNAIANNVIYEYNKKIDKLNDEFNINESSLCEEYITPLKLQKLLYYIQGLSLKIFGKVAYENKIYAWAYGPVIEDVYNNYKGRATITTPVNKFKISEGLEKIISIVIDSYGQIEAEKLIDLTHDEEPWIVTKKNNVIDINKIKNYFDKVYEY